MTIGDVFSVVASIFGIFLTAWAATVALSLLLANVVERARKETDRPKVMLLRGLVFVLTIGFPGFAMLASPVPLLKIVGFGLLLGLLTMAAIGLSGLAQAAGRRIQDLDSTMATYPAVVRGAAFTVGATLLPIVGWFGLGPILLILSLGAGSAAVFSYARKSTTVEAI
jgi:hypothetical protein